MIQINFAGHGIEITPAIRNLIDKKFKRIERHFNHPIIGVNVILSVQKLNNIAEVKLLVKGAEINAKANDDDMYKAIDTMMDKLNRQLMKHKQKMVGHE